MSARVNRSIAVVAFVCLVAGLALSRLVEPGVRIQTVTLAGDTPALHFLPAGPGPHPVALLAHGFSGSKENLVCYGEALAAAGFECYSVDGPGHGASPQLYSFMEVVRTLEAVAHAVGPVDVFIGHSMGGFTGGEAVREGGLKPKLFIALGSLPVLGEHGPPLLLLAGAKEEIFTPSMLKARTDARCLISPWSNHTLEAWDRLLVNAAGQAACTAVGRTPPAAATCWLWRLLGIVLAMLGALGLAFSLPKLPPPWAWGRGLFVAAIFIIAFVLTTGMWRDVMPHLRYFPAQGAAIAIIFLVLLGLGRLRVPWWGVTVLACVLWLCVIAIPVLRSFLMSRMPLFTMVFSVAFIPAWLIGTLLGRVAARHGSRFDADLALAIIVGCAIFQWGRPPRIKAPEAAPAHVAIKLDAKFYDACAGEYEVAPDNLHWDPIKLKVWRQGEQLMGQASGASVFQGVFEIYPESETNFFVINGAQLIFTKNEKREVTDVISRMAGSPDKVGKKVKP
jgi:pimeloyl-ACP methyl ester carboxylesterase